MEAAQLRLIFRSCYVLAAGYVVCVRTPMQSMQPSRIRYPLCQKLTCCYRPASYALRPNDCVRNVGASTETARRTGSHPGFIYGDVAMFIYARLDDHMKLRRAQQDPYVHAPPAFATYGCMRSRKNLSARISQVFFYLFGRQDLF